MIGDVLAVYKFLSEEIQSANVLSAIFSWDGTKKSGDEIIKIRIHGNVETDKNWFYEVEPYGDYIFIPFPVNPSVNVDYGRSSNDKNPNVNYFRYVSSPMAKFSSGGEENLKVDFFVFGYQSDDLLNLKKKRSA